MTPTPRTDANESITCKEGDPDALREALIELVLATQGLGELEIPGAKDAEDVDHILSVGDCRRIAQAVAKAKTTLEDLVL